MNSPFPQTPKWGEKLRIANPTEGIGSTSDHWIVFDES